MPAERSSISLDQAQQEQPQSQVKVCSSCHSTLIDGSFVFLPEADAIVCIGCRERISSARSSAIPLDDSHIFSIDVDPAFVRTLDGGANTLQNTRHTSSAGPASFDSSNIVDPRSEFVPAPSHGSHSHPPTHSAKPPLSGAQSNNSTFLPSQQVHSSSSTNAIISARRHPSHAPYPDPLTDLTRLRVRPQAHNCLYPGATFQGTQKSGRNSYDVNVTIVDVDFASSYLCGYLRIRGLTDDWPELTTYFDAEIIGSRYGFLTQNWGASEQDDMVHWSRFPAFKHVKNELRKPRCTIPDRDRGAVFMRWKERFLVPDHRVQDINGASFAGFYYVCVDFNPSANSCSTTTRASASFLESDDGDSSFLQSMTKSEPIRRPRRDSSARHAGRRVPSASPRRPVPVATMSGFYFHQNSEPYQQLSLCHIPERGSSSFEFR